MPLRAFLLQVEPPAGTAAEALSFVLAQQCCTATQSVTVCGLCSLPPEDTPV